MFHLAQGVLVGLRRRPPEEVLNESSTLQEVRTVTIGAAPRASGRRRRRDGRGRRRSGRGTSMLGRPARTDCCQFDANSANLQV